MPFDSNGNYTVPPGSAAVEGEIISVEAYNDLLADLETSLSEVLLKSGIVAMEAALDMAGRQIKNLAIGTDAGDALRRSQVFPKLVTKWMSPTEDEIYNTAIATGTWDALTSNCVSVVNNGTGVTNVARIGGVLSPITGPWFLRFPDGATKFVNSILLRCPGGVDYSPAPGSSVMLLPFSTTNNAIPNGYRLVPLL